MKPRKNLYYLPGTISLIFLCPITLLFLYNNGFLSREKILEVVWTSSKTFESDSVYAPQFYLNENYQKRKKILNKKYVHIDLNGDKKADLEKLIAAEKRIKKLILGQDTVNGVHFKFEANTQYWTLVYALNILEKNKITDTNSRYFLGYWNYEDELWIWISYHIPYPNYVDGLDNDMIFPKDFLSKRIAEENNLQKKKEAKSLIEYKESNNYKLATMAILFLILLILSILKLRVK